MPRMTAAGQSSTELPSLTRATNFGIKLMKEKLRFHQKQNRYIENFLNKSVKSIEQMKNRQLAQELGLDPDGHTKLNIQVIQGST